VDCSERRERSVYAPVRPHEADAATAVSGRPSSEAFSFVYRVRAGERGDDAGLSEPRYVVAKMLSRSDSCGWSTEGVHRCSMASGAVLERPVCERLLGGSSARAGAEGWAPPWPGVCGAFDLTDAGGDGRLGAGEGCDMESTLVKPRRGTFGCAWVSVWQILPEAAREAAGTRTRLLGRAVALRETAAPAAVSGMAALTDAGAGACAGACAGYGRSVQGRPACGSLESSGASTFRSSVDKVSARWRRGYTSEPPR
jgi:hypothetical protein